MNSTRMVLLSAVSFLAHGAVSELPLYFEANSGQTDPEVKFLARAKGYTAFLTQNELILRADGGVVRIGLAAANHNSVLSGEQPRSSTSNYFIGSDPNHWKRSVPHFQAVRGPDVYPGIDVLYYARGRVIEFDFIVQPGSDPSQIRLHVDAENVGRNDDGDLVIHAGGETFHLKRPEIYQEVNGTRQPVAGGYVQRDSNWGFELGPFDRRLPLIIDPEIDFSTFLGGAGAERVFDVALDLQGFTYAAGQTASADFPRMNALQNNYAGGVNDAFITKLDPQGELVFSTFIGGANSEGVNGIALDVDGAIYATGFTGSNAFPITTGLTRLGGWDTFVLKLNADGNSLAYSTLLTGTADDFGHAIAVDAQKNAYVTGITNSANFPVTANAFDTTANGDFDLFITKLNPLGTTRLWSSYLGGSGSDRGDLVDITLNSWAVFVAAFTGSPSLPVRNALQANYGGQFDVLLAGFNLDGALGFLSYEGGPTNDGGYAIWADSVDNLYVGGSTSFGNFPGAGGMVPQSFDGFVQKLHFPSEFNAPPQVIYTTLAGNAASTITRGFAPLGNVLGVGFGSTGGPIALRGGPPPTPVPNCSAGSSTASSGWLDMTTGQPLGGFSCDGQNMEYGRAGGNSQGTRMALNMSGSGMPLFPGVLRPPGDLETTSVLFGFSAPTLTGDTTTVDAGNGYGDLDPVATATGELYETSIDLRLRGPLPLQFERYYGSLLDTNAGWSALGSNWRHNFDVRLTAASEQATVVLERGRTIRFVRSGTVWQLSSAEDLAYQLASAGHNYRFLNAANDLVYNFDFAGRLTRIEDRNGNALTVAPGPYGPLSVSDGLGRMLTFTYTGNRLTRVADQSGRQIQFRHSGDTLTEFTDANGNVTSYEYLLSAARGALLTTTTLPGGNRPFAQIYDARGRVLQQTDASAQTWKVAYNQPQAGVTTVTDPIDRSTRHTHTGPTNFTGFSDAQNLTATRAYDANRRLTSITDRLGDTIRVTYDAASGRPSAVTDAAGQTRRYTYAAQTQAGFTFYNVTRIEFPDGAADSFSYDERGNLLAFTDTAGKVWTRTYNSRGQVLTDQDPAGGTVLFTYNNDGTMSTYTNAAGETFRVAYDEAKRPIRTTFADNTLRQITYDALSNPLTMVDEIGNITRVTYNRNNRIATVTYADGAVWTFGYDSDDRLTSITDPLGKAEIWTYTETGRLKSVRNPAGDTLTIDYDSHGWPVAITDGAGKTSRIAQDVEGVPASVTDPLGRVWQFQTDKLGRQTRRTNPAGESIQFAFSATGQPTTFTNALGDRDVYTYDARDFLVRAARPEGAVSFTRDDRGWISEIVDAIGSSWKRTRDAAGRVISETDPLGRIWRHTRDQRGRLIQTEMPGGNVALTLDALGRPTVAAYSDGTALAFTYDARGRVVSGTGLAFQFNARGEMTQSNGLAVPRDDVGRISSITYAAGRTVTYAYNQRGLLTRVADWAGGAIDFTYDDSGARVGVMRSNGVRTTFTWDSAARLRSIQESGGGVNASLALTRDSVGNITQAERNLPQNASLTDGSDTFTYDAAGHAGAYTYDDLGRVTARKGQQLTWDLAGRLRSITSAGAAVEFTYDAYGLPLTASRGGSSQSLVWNYATGLPTLAVERSGSADTRYYIYEPDGALLFSIDAATGARQFYHFDEAGNTTFLTNSDGAVTDAYGITPYGEVISRSGTSVNPFTFGGQWGAIEEPGTGLFRMRFRYYDATAARFVSRDPVQKPEPREFAVYQYASGNPLVFADPWGLDSALLGAGQTVLEGVKAHGEGAENGYTSPEFILQSQSAGFAAAETAFNQAAQSLSNQNLGLLNKVSPQVIEQFENAGKASKVAGTATSALIEGVKAGKRSQEEGYGGVATFFFSLNAACVDVLEGATLGRVPFLKDIADGIGFNQTLQQGGRLAIAATAQGWEGVRKEFKHISDGKSGAVPEGFLYFGENISDFCGFGDSRYYLTVEQTREMLQATETARAATGEVVK